MAFAASTIVLGSRKLRRRTPLLGTCVAILVVTALLNLCGAWSGRPIGGLLATAPFLAYGLAALSNRQSGKTDRLMMYVFVGYIVLVCLATPVDPGLQWGPRFLLPALPAGTVLALSNYRALAREHSRSRTRHALTASLLALLLVSLLCQVVSLRVMSIIKERDRQLIADTAALDSQYVVSDEYGYAQYVAPLFYGSQFFYVRSQEDYHRLTEVFVRNDVRTYAVATYPTPHRRAIDPLNVSGDYVVTEVEDQLFQIERTEHDR
jgi:hypothetical protein